MGAHFRLRLCLDRTWEEIAAILAGLRILVARPGDGAAYWEIDWQLPTALVIGGEAEGAGAEAERKAAGYVTIPLSGPVESLNAGVAAGVLLMEAARQRLGCGC
jgi:tRNA G18 (ribose-2'-O)-methylase SpoU